ncbi:outer membrane beta-barrel protein [Reichenbachiella agariperforans]|uniref:Putative beta-barrel porin-2, OmpL-like. bbp2 n=1 Tax=Reichenbachiella agariperforans TaxID=156994 RepID=A0A1M6ND65_REIAG|nr:outer membrane beta-barrel protein [Reichenbachiella agariperforans]MBU2915833.1 porin [Reichenbachiella agariperforans]SHJ93630.1 Putative beta-barrel porin-2, OmpL-like. bbp2 [Reichenbachiella agariperforans]
MKNFTKILLAALLVVSFAASAQDEEDSSPALSISGSVDTYYRANLNASNNPEDGSVMAPGSSFANQPGFALGMANLVIGLEGEKTGFVADLVFGPRGTDAVFGSTTASSSIVNQLYAYWMVSDAVTLTVGNFNTFLGYEVISPTANFNYSTSYMFSYGPFSHSGLKADVSLGDVSIMAGVFNPTDATDFNPSADYVFGAQIGYGGAYLNAILSEDFYQFDLTAGWDLTETVYLGVNATTAKESFSGAALYLQNSFSDDFSLGLRGEYLVMSEDAAGFEDPDSMSSLIYTAPGDAVIDLTLSANYSIGALTLIPEVRVDLYAEDTIQGSADATDTQNSLASFVFAAVYSF